MVKSEIQALNSASKLFSDGYGFTLDARQEYPKILVHGAQRILKRNMAICSNRSLIYRSCKNRMLQTIIENVFWENSASNAHIFNATIFFTFS